MEPKKEILDAEILEDITNPDWDFEKKSQKKPRGTRKKDHPQFTPKNRMTILKWAATGAPLEICAAYAGVSLTLVGRWLKRGSLAQDRIDAEEGNELSEVELEFAAFFMACKQQEAAGAMSPIATWVKAAQEDWKAAAAYLEKTQPYYFGAKQYIEGHITKDVRIIGGGKNQAIDTDEITRRLSSESLRKLKASLVERKQLKSGEESSEEE